jgi:hypothetical protein
MNKVPLYRFFLSVFLLSLAGCAPIIPFVSSSSIPPIPNNLLHSTIDNGDQDILVIPVWGQQQQFRYIIDSATIINSSSIQELSNVVGSRTSYGMVGLAAARGKTIEFEGMYLLSKKADAILMRPLNNGWGAILTAKLDRWWYLDLVAKFRESDQVSIWTYGANSFWDAHYKITRSVYIKRTTSTAKDVPEWLSFPMQQWFPGKKRLEFLLPETHRKRIVDFLQSIPDVYIAKVQSVWRQSAITEQ